MLGWTLGSTGTEYWSDAGWVCPSLCTRFGWPRKFRWGERWTRFVRTSVELCSVGPPPGRTECPPNWSRCSSPLSSFPASIGWWWNFRRYAPSQSPDRPVNRSTEPRTAWIWKHRKFTFTTVLPVALLGGMVVVFCPALAIPLVGE